VADELLVGVADIARAAGADERSVWRWADPDACDPLRLEYLHGVPRILRSVLKAWQRRRTPGNGERRIRGWEAICKCAELSRTSAWRAARDGVPDRLPVHLPKNGRPWAYAAAIDDWRNARVFPVRVQRDRVRALRLAAGLLDGNEQTTTRMPRAPTGARRLKRGRLAA
jgi:hypothetical protein